MILIDPRGGNSKEQNIPKEMVDIIKRLGVKSELQTLEYGDAAFEGIGPHGTVLVGVERKALHDMLNCIDDARFSGHQRIGMKQMYAISVLMVEGYWRPHDGNGLLMEGFNGGTSWGFCRYRSQRTLYSKLYRYLCSVMLSGVAVSYSRDVFHTSFNIVEWYQYFQKPWDQHTSMLETHKVAIPTLNAKPSLTRLWANDIAGVGTKLSMDAEKLFKKPINLALADEGEWLKLPGIGVKTAQQIVREVMGVK